MTINNRPDSTVVATNEPNKSPLNDINRNSRGLNIYNPAQLVSLTGRDERGQLLTWGVEQPYFYLTVQQRTEIVKLCAPVFAIVASRQQRISSMDFTITPLKKKEDEIVDFLKDAYGIYSERAGSTDLGETVVMAQMVQKVKQYLPDILPDMRNFHSSMLRWSRRIKTQKMNKSNEIKGWLMEPNNGITWETFVKKWVFSLLVHGAAAVYKQVINKKVENFDVLPGGSIYKLKSQYFSGMAGYIQFISGYEPQIMFEDELSYAEYLPNADQNHSMIPLEALVNKVCESFFFDKLMADQADGTKPPEKVVIVTNPADPFGDFDKPQEVPLPVEEQKRIETKINTPRKFAAIVMSGNDAKVIDLTRENTMALQSERQKDIRNEVGLVFNASPLEMNLGGSENTSGRQTAEMQYEIDLGRGVYPMVRLLETKMNRDILPFRYGYGYEFGFGKVKNEREQREIDTIRLANGEITVNELREEKGLHRFPSQEHDMPRGSTQQNGESSATPIYTKDVG